MSVRFNTCIRWMVGILNQKSLLAKGTDHEKALQEYLGNGDNKVPSSVVKCLTTPLLYWSIYVSFIDKEEDLVDDSPDSFWTLIQSLARQGIYLVKEDDTSINDTNLRTVNPFDEAAHCVMMEGLMRCHASIIAPTSVIVKETRRLFGLSASKELPSSMEEALLLWINKASRAAFSRHQKLCQEILQEENPAKKREARLRLAKEGGGRVELCRKALCVSDLCDGQCIGATLIYYMPSMIEWKDFHFSRQLLTPDSSLSNLEAISSHCTHLLTDPMLHIKPMAWLSHSDELCTNVLSFLALLFSVLTKVNMAECQRQAPSVLSIDTTMSGKGARRKPAQDNSSLKSHNKQTSTVVNSFLSNSTQLSELSSTSCSAINDSLCSQSRSHPNTPDLVPDNSLQSFSLPNISGTSSKPGSLINSRPLPINKRLLFPEPIKSSNHRQHPLNVSQTMQNRGSIDGHQLITASIERLGIMNTNQPINRLTINEVNDNGGHKQNEEQKNLKNENQSMTATCETEDVSDKTEAQNENETVNRDEDVNQHETALAENHDREVQEDTRPREIQEVDNIENNDNNEDREGLKSSEGGVNIASPPLDSSRLVLDVFSDDPPSVPLLFETDEEALLLRTKVRLKMKQIQVKREEKKRQEQQRIERLKQKLYKEINGNHEVDEQGVPHTVPDPLKDLGSVMNQDPPPSNGSTLIDSEAITHQPPLILVTRTHDDSKCKTSRPRSSRSNHSRPNSATCKPTVMSREKDNELNEVDRKLKRKQEIKLKMEERDKERKRLAVEKKKQIKALAEDGENMGIGASKSTDNVINKTILLNEEQQPVRRRVFNSAGQNKSNRKLVRNALCSVCLAGEANINVKQKALKVLDDSLASHFYILFRDTLGLKFKGLYGFIPEDLKLSRLFGTGPKVIDDRMVKQFFKYNSGAKSFQSVVAYSFSLSTDALTIQDHYWTAATKKTTMI